MRAKPRGEVRRPSKVVRSLARSWRRTASSKALRVSAGCNFARASTSTEGGDFFLGVIYVLLGGRGGPFWKLRGRRRRLDLGEGFEFDDIGEWDEDGA